VDWPLPLNAPRLLVAYSGGKDSTVVLDMAYRLWDGGRVRELAVVHNEELLKAPPLFQWVYEVLSGVARAGVGVYVIVPKDDFISTIFEKRYSPPGHAFTWCVARMKERPTRRFMEQIGGRWVKATGVRLEESAHRERVIRSRCGAGAGACGCWLQKSTGVSLEIAPIVDWTAEEVVEYLRTRRRPWDGGDYSYLLDVVYCGKPKLRNGCTLCTLVRRDPMLLTYAECFRDGRYARVAELKSRLAAVGFDWGLREHKSKKLNDAGLRAVRELLADIFTTMPELLAGYATFKPQVIERHLPEVAHLLPKVRAELKDVEVLEL
jgi:DNA sulfur modification protein DndC